MKTPLSLYIEATTTKPVATNNGDVIRKTVKELTTSTRNKRQRLVGEYMLRCAEQNTMVGDHGFGSLHFVLKWLRDNAVDTYEISGRAAISAAIKGDWPLENAIHFLADTHMVQEYLPAMWKGDNSRQKLKAELAWVNEGPFRVAVNCSSKNLTQIAFQSGADIYLGASDEGAVVKARSGLTISPVLVEQLGSTWVQPYPDMVITKLPTDDPSEILDMISEQVILAPERVKNELLGQNNY